MQTTISTELLSMIDAHVIQFLDHVRVANKSWGGSGEASNRGRFESSFSAIWPDDPDYYAYKFLRGRIEYHIRQHLVNPTLNDLFDAYGIKNQWPQSDYHTEAVQPSNRAYERKKKYEFKAEYDGKRIAYRYTYPAADEFDVGSFLINEEVDHIEVVDWFDVMSEESSYGCAQYFDGDRKAIHDVTVRTFFCSYFGEELYDACIPKLLDAVAQAKEIIGLKTIRNLSSGNLDEFKNTVKGFIEEFRHGVKAYQPSAKSGGRKRYLSRSLRNNLNKVFFEEGMCKALFGESDFAQSFITSEYLFSIIGKKDQVDYTPVILGYIKAVEQLSRTLMELTIEAQGSCDLWIKRNNEPFPEERKGEISRGHPNRAGSKKIDHIPFTEDNRDFFDTTMGPLVYFLTDNKDAWGKNAGSVGFIRSILLDYDTCDRNGYVHADNITSFEEASRIRSNAYLLFYILLGGYETPGTIVERLEKLHADTHSFDSLVKSMNRLMHWDNTFILQFAGGHRIRVVRLPSVELHANEVTQHPNSMRFAKIDHYDQTQPLRDFIDTLPESGFVELSKNNLPVKVWAIPINGSPKLIWLS